MLYSEMLGPEMLDSIGDVQKKDKEADVLSIAQL